MVPSLPAGEPGTPPSPCARPRSWRAPSPWAPLLPSCNLVAMQTDFHSPAVAFSLYSLESFKININFKNTFDLRN